MKKIVILFIAITSITVGFGQSGKADDAYKKANKYFEEKNYFKAIEFYTRSIEIDAVADAYYNRALAYFHLADSCNFCRDLHSAYILGDIEAEKLYSGRCVVNDTVREKLDSVIEKLPGYSYTLYSRSICDEFSSYSYRDSKGEVIFPPTDNSAPIFTIVEEMPEFVGGEIARNRFLSENIHYPQTAMKNGIQGVVYLQFILEKDGSISDIRVLKGIGGGCDAEACRVIKLMPKWKPGRQNGKNVRVLFNMPISFVLQG